MSGHSCVCVCLCVCVYVCVSVCVSLIVLLPARSITKRKELNVRDMEKRLNENQCGE